MNKSVDHKPNQNERILAYIERTGSITQLEAWKYCGVARLASRISDLRSRGHSFVTDWIEVTNQFGEKCRVKRYRFEEE